MFGTNSVAISVLASGNCPLKYGGKKGINFVRNFRIFALKITTNFKKKITF